MHFDIEITKLKIDYASCFIIRKPVSKINIDFLTVYKSNDVLFLKAKDDIYQRNIKFKIEIVETVLKNIINKKITMIDIKYLFVCLPCPFNFPFSQCPSKILL